jgi:hypothetical protein
MLEDDKLIRRIEVKANRTKKFRFTGYLARSQNPPHPGRKSWHSGRIIPSMRLGSL